MSDDLSDSAPDTALARQNVGLFARDGADVPHLRATCQNEEGSMDSVAEQKPSGGGSVLMGRGVYRTR